MTEDFFEKLLNFSPEWKVERIDFNENNEVDIYLKWNLEEYKDSHKTSMNLYRTIGIIVDGGILIFCNSRLLLMLKYPG